MRLQPLLERHIFQYSTHARLKASFAAIVLIAFFATTGRAEPTQQFFPGFRHIDTEAKAPPPLPKTTVRLLTDDNFAPWSFMSAENTVKGISVELALAVCTEMRLQCEVKEMPFVELMPALLRGDGDVVISGLNTNEDIVRKTDPTAAYFVSMGRFVTRLGSPLSAPDVRTLAGRRIGYVKATAHGAFIEKFYERSALTPFDNAQAMLEALRTGALDAVFGDSLALGYWLRGSLSRACCVPLGRAFVDRSTFSRNLVFLVRQNQPELQGIFDISLDRLESEGVTAKVFGTYLPGPIW